MTEKAEKIPQNFQADNMDGNIIKYSELKAEDISTELFAGFRRHQVVEKCMRKIDGEWKAIDNPFVEDWGEKEYAYLAECLINTVRTGGVVYGAFRGSRLVGFASAESKFFGSREQYLELSSIHVTEDFRGHGTGKKLFRLIAEWARDKGGEKLYISAHSSVESQSFYKAVGCTEAEEYSSYHAEKEPCDCQLEYKLR